VNFDITLEPHRGERMNDAGVREVVEMDQYLIFVSGAAGSEDAFREVRGGRSREHIGYVGKKPGAPINFLKVVLAFGDHSSKMFTLMVRQALMAKARERMEEAAQSAKDAAALAEQAKELVVQQRELQLQESDALAAQQMAELAMAESLREMDEAQGVIALEESTDRPASAPDRAVVNAILAEGRNPPKESSFDSVADLADSQNL